MDPAQAQQKEKNRLQALDNLRLLDTPREDRFDRITRLTSIIMGISYAGVSLIGAKREWVKSAHGLHLEQLLKNQSISRFVITQDGVFQIPDLAKDSRFANHFWVQKEPYMRFYAGIPLLSVDNKPVGVFWMMGKTPKTLTDNEVKIFLDLSTWAKFELNKNAGGRTVDIKELHEIQEKLSYKNRELAEINVKREVMLQSIGDGVIGINDKGEIVYINERVEEMTGYSKDDLVGKLLIHAVRLVDKDGSEVVGTKRPIRNALFSKKRIFSSSWYYTRKDGSKFPAAITATPVVLYGRVTGGVNVFRDITKEKEIDRMKTEFISLASHQLRTPLSAMKWFSEMLIEGDVGTLSDEQMEIVNNIYHSNQRMIALVNTLLNISRIESGRIIVDPKPTDLEKLVKEVVLELQPRLRKKKHNLVVSVHGSLPKVNIDPRLVRHVYMNLLTNALKYTSESGEIVVMISKSGDDIVSQISDNGFGIPKHQQKDVYKKFFRAENIIKIETDGTGLGLYLTKAIVDSSGGKIWFESEVGKGTTFWFSLPMAGSRPKKGEVTLDS